MKFVSAYHRKGTPHVWITYRDVGGKRTARSAPGVSSIEEGRKLAEAISEKTLAADERHDPDAIKWLIANRVISEDGAASTYGYRRVETSASPVPTIMEAAESHPTTRREKETADNVYRYHRKGVEEFTALFGTSIQALTIENVEAYLKDLKGRKKAPTTRTHRLTWLRRASRMATQWGFPDVLMGLHLDRVESQEVKEVDGYTFPELVRIAKHLIAVKDTRRLAAFALQAFMGLRPSEACRLRVDDLRGSILCVGQVKAKRISSRRWLPIPAVVLPWLRAISKDRDRAHALILSHHRAYRRLGKGFRNDDFGRWLSKPFKAAVGRRCTTGSLRKSWASWAFTTLKVDSGLVETYYGHRISNVLPVTARHYLLTLQEVRLRAVAQGVNSALRHQLQSRRKRALSGHIVAGPVEKILA